MKIRLIFTLLLTSSLCLSGCKEVYVYDSEDAYYAAQASVSSDNSYFTATKDGGEIHFKTEGGSVTVNVSCGCDWIAENTDPDMFRTSTTSTSMTVTAEQNTVENELTSTITLKTAERRVTFATIRITQNAYGAPEISVSANEWHAPAYGARTIEITVEASAEWTFEISDEWLKVINTGNGLVLTADINAETEERSTKVTLACTDGIRTTYEYIAVTQDGAAYITLSKKSLKFSKYQGSASLTVESNYRWDYTYDTSIGWFSVTRDGDELTVSVTANENNNDRESIITITAGDGADNIAEEQLPINQVGQAMLLTYTITASHTTISLPLYGTVKCTVNWGDGSTNEPVTSVLPSHTYAAVGNYDITINGTVTALNSYDISSSSNPLPLTAIIQWGDTGLTDMQYAFYYCTNLVSLPEESGDAFNNVTTFDSAFYGCSGITEIPEGLFDGCPEATSFNSTFYGCTSLLSVPTELFSNNLKVTDFSHTFEKDAALKGESPYDMIDGKKVHLYERYDYPDIYADPASKENCFNDCTGLSDYSVIPFVWGGGMDYGVTGTYTAHASINDGNNGLKEVDWTVKIYPYTGSYATDSYDYWMDGALPCLEGAYASYEDHRYSAGIKVSDTTISLPTQIAHETITPANIAYYAIYTPCVRYSSDSGFSYNNLWPDLTFTYNSNSGIWTSNYGLFLGACNSSTTFELYAFFQAAAPVITLNMKSNSTSLSTENKLSHPITEGLIGFTNFKAE